MRNRGLTSKALKVFGLDFAVDLDEFSGQLLLAEQQRPGDVRLDGQALILQRGVYGHMHLH